MSTKQANWPFVLNLGNSIIGVSVLAMPFCFKQCGLFLAILLLCGSAFLTQISCQLLTKGAHTSKKRSYEYLALHTFGPAGKLCVEISIIGLLIGTCVAFFVIIGDLGPTFISRQLGLENTWNLRMCLMVFLALFVTLPLSLMKNVESLSNISALSIGFYAVFIAEVFITAFPNLWSGIWVAKVAYWRPEGIFKCIPIFSLAFACQTQLFVMYDALAEPSLKRINDITKNAIGMCAAAYLLVGYFGYVAFCQEDISGDILLNFKPTIFSEAVKLGFVLSVAVSFPLIIFPLRTALYTLLFYREHKKTELMGPIYIPDMYLKGITFFIIITTLIIGILLPNIEFVLAMTGATMGSMICFIFPAVMFISVMSMSNNHGKTTAQFVLFLGVTILLASTYVTLNAQDKAHAAAEFNKAAKGAENLGVPPEFVDKSAKDNMLGNAGMKDTNVQKGIGDSKKETKNPETEGGGKQPADEKEVDDKRQEPPNPQAPQDKEVKAEDKELQEEIKKGEIKIQEEINKMMQEEKDLKAKQASDSSLKPSNKPEMKDGVNEKKEDVKQGQNTKEDTQKLLDELKQQQKLQQQLIKEQKNIIQELKQHQKEAHVNSAQQQVVQGIGNANVQQNIANQANANQQKVVDMQQVLKVEEKPNIAQEQPLNQAHVQQNQGQVPLAQSNQAPLQKDVGNMQTNQVQQQQNIANVPPNQAQQQQNVANVLPNQGQEQANAANAQPNQVPQQNVANVQPNQAQQQQNVANVLPNQAQQQQNVANVQPNQAQQQQNVANVQPNQAQQQNIANVQPNQAQQQQNIANVQPNQAQQQQNVANVQSNQAQQQNVLNVQPNQAKQASVQAQQQPNIAQQQHQQVDQVNNPVNNHNNPVNNQMPPDNNQIYKLLQNLILNNSNIIKEPDSKSAEPGLAQLKANLEKIIAEGKSKQSLDNFINDKKFQQFLQNKENLQSVQALRKIISDLHSQQSVKKQEPQNAPQSNNLKSNNKIDQVPNNVHSNGQPADNSRHKRNLDNRQLGGDMKSSPDIDNILEKLFDEHEKLPSQKALARQNLQNIKVKKSGNA